MSNPASLRSLKEGDLTAPAYTYLKKPHSRDTKLPSKDQNDSPKRRRPHSTSHISWWSECEDMLIKPGGVTVLPPEPSYIPHLPESIKDMPWHRSRYPLSSSGFDHGWEPPLSRNPSLLSSSGVFSDIPITLTHGESNGSGRCIAAGRAFDCVSRQESPIRSTLTQCRWEGEYMIQVGFNEEILRLEQGLLQEIHIFFEKDITPPIIKSLSAALHPFPVHFHTPSRNHCVPELPPQNKDFWEVWRHHGIFRASSQPPVDGDSQSGGSRALSLSGRNSGSGSSDKCGGRKQESDDSENDDSECGGGDNNGGDNPTKMGRRTRAPASCGISIPFSSTLTCKGEDTPSGPHPSMQFKIHACIDIKMEPNSTYISRPLDSNWGGPWLGAKMTLLDAGIQEVTSSNPLGYYLGLSQVRIITSSCPSSILQFSPTTVRAEDDGIVTKTEKTRKGGIQATFSASPSVRLEGTYGSSSGEETVWKRWEILPYCLGPDRNEVTGAPQTTMMWKYIHNDKCYQHEAGNVFNPLPSAIFGLSRAARRMPILEVEAIMHYSCTGMTTRMFGGGWPWLGGNQVPMYMNFLHQASVVVDLDKVEGNSWVVGLGAHDRQDPDQLGVPFPTVVEQTESYSMRDSACDVFLGRALHGCVGLSAKERKNGQPLLCSITPSSPAKSSDTPPHSSSSFLHTPTPSPSPSPPSSPSRRGAADYITKIPAGYVVNGRRFKDRGTALRMANMLKNVPNIRTSP